MGRHGLTEDASQTGHVNEVTRTWCIDDDDIPLPCFRKRANIRYTLEEWILNYWRDGQQDGREDSVEPYQEKAQDPGRDAPGMVSR